MQLPRFNVRRFPYSSFAFDAQGNGSITVDGNGNLVEPGQGIAIHVSHKFSLKPAVPNVTFAEIQERVRTNWPRYAGREFCDASHRSCGPLNTSNQSSCMGHNTLLLYGDAIPEFVLGKPNGTFSTWDLFDDFLRLNDAVADLKAILGIADPSEVTIDWAKWFDGLALTSPRRRVASQDPNDKVGSNGSGAPHYYISGEEALRYVVYFENVVTATAPAQEVVVVDDLDPAIFDLGTFRFGPVAFGNVVVELPAGVAVESTVDLRPAADLLVRVRANLNQGNGHVEWRFSSLDPATGLPTEDPLAGFLPPNETPPEGDGSVVFTVAPRAGLSTGTQITNQASIVFDTNDAILTPEWLNTINQPRCGTAPDTGCRRAASGASSLKLRDYEGTSKDTFAWKWNKGGLTELVDFRDPIRGFNDYRICIYDSSSSSQPLMEAEVFPGENCGNAKCWKATGTTGFKFKSTLGVPEGVTTLTLKAGAAGKAKLVASGKGSNLRLPSPPLAAGPVTVQFIANDGRSRECWETVYSAPTKNEVGRFDAKGP